MALLHFLSLTFYHLSVENKMETAPDPPTLQILNANFIYTDFFDEEATVVIGILPDDCDKNNGPFVKALPLEKEKDIIPVGLPVATSISEDKEDNDDRPSRKYQYGCIALLLCLVVLSLTASVIYRNDRPFIRCSIKNRSGEYDQGMAMFQLTQGEVPETADFDEACKSEFGPDARVADWTYDLKAQGKESVELMINDLGIIPTFNEKYYFVSNEGSKYYEGGRVYFFENHGGSPPSNWLVHDQLGDITLGSWFGTGQVLCAV